VTTALKAISQQEFQKCFQQWQHRSRGVLKRCPLSVSCKYVYTGMLAIKSFRDLHCHTSYFTFSLRYYYVT
jgi:hypothetical protein